MLKWLWIGILTVSLAPLSAAKSDSTGSLWTMEQEVTQLSQHAQVSQAIKQSAQAYLTQLEGYQKGSLSYGLLATTFQKISAAQLAQVAKLISQDSTGAIQPIEDDYNSSQTSEYNLHLLQLIGLCQEKLGIPAYQCQLPPSTDRQNLLQNGDFSHGSSNWTLSSGSGTAQVSSPDPHDTTSPVYNKNSLSFAHVPSKPGYMSLSQKISTTPGHTYLVGAYIIGTPPAGDGAYSGGINLNGARSLTSTITKLTTPYPQSSNEIDQAGMHRIFYWVEACEDSMTVSLTGGEGTVFKYVVAYDITSETNKMAFTESYLPVVRTSGPLAVGHYPQVEWKLASGENLLDGGISFQDNIDQSALKNAGHPYWYIDGGVPANKSIAIVNAANGEHGLYMPTNASVTTNAPVPCPDGDYTLSLQVYVPDSSKGSIKVDFSGTTLIDNSSVPKQSQEFDGLTSGVNPIEMDVHGNGKMFRPSATFTSTGDGVYIYGATLVPKDSSVYDKINAVNPYDPDRDWYKGGTFSYDFTKGVTTSDWAVALTGNTMFAPGTPASNYTQVVADGILLKSERSGTFSNGGVQSTQFICPQEDFSISVTFSATNDGTYEPTFAVWIYGETQRGPGDPLYHTNGPGAVAITEFDCEVGSDLKPNVPPPSNEVCMRDGSYIGHSMGGQSEYIDPVDPKTGSNWKVLDNFWNDGKSHTLKMEGKYTSDGRLILTRSFDGTADVFQQDLGTGPFSPANIKIALENPGWNSRGSGNGSAEVTIHSIDITTSPIGTNGIGIGEIDYGWFTPGGGGSCSYTIFE